MGFKKAIPFVAAGALAWLLMRRAGAAALLNLEVGLPRNISLQADRLTASLPLAITNGSPQRFRIGSFFLPVYSGNTLVGQVRNPAQATELPPSSTTTVQADAQITLTALPAVLAQVLANGGKLPVLTVKGNVNTGTGNLFVNKNFEIPLPQWMPLPTR